MTADTKAGPSSDAQAAVVATFGVMIASILFGLVPLFARGLTDAGMTASAVAFWRYALAAVLLGPALVAAARRGLRAEALWAVVAGASMGLGWIGYVEALNRTSVATAGVLYMTYPLFALAAHAAMTRRGPNLRAASAALLVLVAAIVAAGPAVGADLDLAGLAAALAAPATFGLAVVILTEKLPALPPLARIGGAALGASAALSPLLIAAPVASILPPDAPSTWLLVGLALGSALLPQLIYVVAAPRVGPARATVAGSVELPAMFLIGWLAFGEMLEPRHWLAGALIVVATIVSPARRSRRVALTRPETKTR